jgi:hypothetical protein
VESDENPYKKNKKQQKIEHVKLKKSDFFLSRLSIKQFIIRFPIISEKPIAAPKIKI